MSELRAVYLAFVSAAMCVRLTDAGAQPAAPTPTAQPSGQRPSTPIGLPEVLQVAIRQSPAIARAVVDLEAARADALAAEGLDDVTLTASATASRTPVFLPGTLGVYEQDVLALSVGATRGLPSGGTVSGTAGARAISERFDPGDMATVPTGSGVVATLSASITHPLLRGFGERIARADRRRARVAQDVATLQQTAEALTLIRDVVIAYWQVAYARQLVDIRVEGLRLATEQLRITQTAVRTGTVSPTEVLAAEHAIAAREQAVLLAEVGVSQQSLDLRRMVGLEIGRDQIDLAPTTPLRAPPETYDTDAMIARALEQNPVIALLEAQQRGTDIEVEVTEDAIRPRLDVRATLGSTGVDGGPGGALADLVRIDQPTILVGVTYEQQLNARAARGARDKALAERRRVRVDLEAARREITVSVAHAINLMRAAQKRIEVSERAIALARRNLEVQQARFLNGKATNFDIVLRQDELQQADVNRALAVSDALAAQATIEALTGDLLARQHVKITGR